MNSYIQKNLKFNMTVNILDGAFFGLAIGFSSFVTVLPLFINTMTQSALLIGLIPAIHAAGWQFPQLFFSRHVSRQTRYKPMTLFLTIQERIPFLGLAVIAWFIPVLGIEAALALSFLMITWQSLGAGVTAVAWQSMIAKIIPSERRGAFFGFQSAAANLLASMSAILAGLILENLDTYLNFFLCFILCSLAMVISWIMLALTRERENPPENTNLISGSLWENSSRILKRDKNFRWYLVGRTLTQFAMMGLGFFTVYLVNTFAVSKAEAGLMTSVLLGTQIVANPIMGWLSDRWSNTMVMKIGIACAILSVLLAWLAPNHAWFYLIFFLIGIANVANWTIGIIMSLEFSTNDTDRPTYIGLANTLVAPANILAPFLGGWIAQTSSYPTTFLVSALIGGLTLLVFQLFVQDPRKLRLPAFA
ncbi:MAG: hypothetical protein A2Z16_14925 [Chloroflexi bacterium RBG_16_54_18]|nr:MAG: hypothetical protein A2Z16_14925 [Chloroflexi bacterium RBG_16_54_18]